MTRRRRVPPEQGNLRGDQNWYRALDELGQERDDVSWHYLRDWNRDSTGIETLCGEQLLGPQVSTEALPRGKTCERCIQIDLGDTVHRAAERPPQPPEPVQDQPPEVPAGG